VPPDRRRDGRIPGFQTGEEVNSGRLPRERVKTHHVGIYLGGGRMMNAPETGAAVRVDRVAAKKGFAGYFRY
jgi:cell wall-associated NlpC family hydrolase